MAANSRRLFHRAIAIAFVVGSAACANDLTNPSSPTLSPSASAFDKKDLPPIQARGLIDKLGNTLFEVSTGDPNTPSIAPGQLTHVHFKLCKEIEEAKGQPEEPKNPVKQFSANFHYEDKLYSDKEKDDEVDSPLDPDDKSAKDGRVNWDRSAERSTIRVGGYSTFKFTGLLETTRVEVKVTFKLLKDPYKKGNKPYDYDSDDYQTYNVTLCVPVQKAPNPTLTGAGYLGLSGPDFAFSNKPVTYNIFVSDPYGTANVSGSCNLYVQSVISTSPRVLSAPVLIGTGPVTVTGLGGGFCSFDYTFPNGGAYVISASLTGILPIDYDPTDNTGFINVNVSGPTGGGGGGGTGGGGGPEAVVASFSALGTVETVSIPNGPVTITAYSGLGISSVASPAYNPGDEQPSQGVNIKVTLLKLLDGPFTVTAHLATDGNRLGSFTVPNLALDPTVTRKSPGNVPMVPGDKCTRATVVDNPEGYLVQVCVNTITNQTVYYFNAHANFDGNLGHFVPYGTGMSFDSDLITAGKHYRIPSQTFALETASGIRPVCSRPATGPIMATCTYSANTTTRASSDAQRSNIIIFGTDN